MNRVDPRRMTPRDRTADGRFRILVVANEAVESEALHELIRRHAAGRPSDVVIVAPEGRSRVRRFARGGGERHGEIERIGRLLGRLASEGIPAHGWTGTADPVEAIADALAVFEADELIIATSPEWRSDWLAHDVVDRARSRFELPTAHVVVYGARTEALRAA
jgi:GABA permease